MIFSAVRDPRLVTIRRGGTLTDSDHHLLALWAAAAEHCRPCSIPRTPAIRDRVQAIDTLGPVRGEVKMMESRAAPAMPWGRRADKRGAARHAAYAAGEAGCVAHVAAHELGAAALRSRPYAPPRRPARRTPGAGLSAGGSGTSSRRRFASSSSMTSGCGTRSAGRSSTAGPRRRS